MRILVKLYVLFIILLRIYVYKLIIKFHIELKKILLKVLIVFHILPVLIYRIFHTSHIFHIISITYQLVVFQEK